MFFPSLDTMGRVGNGSPFSERRRSAFKKKEDNLSSSSIHDVSAIHISSIDIVIDEENEDSMGIAAELYLPYSICLVSKFGVYDALQVHNLLIS